MISDLLCTVIESAGHQATRVQDLQGIVSERIDADCILASISGAESNLIRDMRILREKSPTIRMIVLCPAQKFDEVRQQADAFADAIIPDDQHIDLVISALMVLDAGFRVVASDKAARTSEETTRPVLPPIQDVALSKRESAILALLRNGYSNKHIGRELEISDSTVKVHLRSIYQKMQVRNRTQAAMLAREKFEHPQ